MIELLEWDSNFFGYRIGKINHSYKNAFLPNDIEFSRFDLVYIFSDYILETKYNLVDIKVTFEKITEIKYFDNNINFFDSTLHSYSELLELAYLSGHDSRFLKDSFFGENAFKKLYKTWLDKSIESPDIDILVCIKDTKIIGFVTFKKGKDSSNIELIAVTPEARGEGLGKKLIDAVEAKLKPNTLLTVPTQETNIKACSFYLKSGFKIKNKIFIYHYAVNTI